MATPRPAKIPSLIYGTAWKKDHTRALVYQALKAGFRGVDTAAQPKHYQEDLVGQGIRDAIKEGIIKREDLYLQTKFTSLNGQDPKRLPYNSKDSITNQVATSVKSSLGNLRHNETDVSTSYIDCLVLHSPLPSMKETQEAWRAMENAVPDQARTLGISNVYQVAVLKALYDSARIKPSVVQNRFYPGTNYDPEIRAFCKDTGMTYESFWTLTANPKLLTSKPVTTVAELGKVNTATALYSLVLGLGDMSVLNGTTNEKRMEDDLFGVEKVLRWRDSGSKDWHDIQKAFEQLITS